MIVVLAMAYSKFRQPEITYKLADPLGSVIKLRRMIPGLVPSGNVIKLRSVIPRLVPWGRYVRSKNDGGAIIGVP